jgi:hypothetical protein
VSEGWNCAEPLRFCGAGPGASIDSRVRLFELGPRRWTWRFGLGCVPFSMARCESGSRLFCCCCCMCSCASGDARYCVHDWRCSICRVVCGVKSAACDRHVYNIGAGYMYDTYVLCSGVAAVHTAHFEALSRVVSSSPLDRRRGSVARTFEGESVSSNSLKARRMSGLACPNTRYEYVVVI